MLLSARTVTFTALAIAVLVLASAQGINRSILDPNGPIAADGSMTAGRARTFHDAEPASGALTPSNQMSDDPADFEPAIERERSHAEAQRAQFKNFGGKLDVSLCKGSDRWMLFLAVRDYYQTRGREKSGFALRGPRATAAIDREWSSATDREIDNYVKHALQYGFLHQRDFSALPEFAKTFADTEEFGEGCTEADAR